MNPSKIQVWQRKSMEVLTSEVVARRAAGPEPSTEWEPVLRQLIAASRSPDEGPAWWTPRDAFFGSVETRMAPSSYHWDGMDRLGKNDHPLFIFQFTLAGWGAFEAGSRAPQRIPPGSAFFAVIPSAHRYYLPASSPGWTFGWLGIYHPYLMQRVSKQVESTGAVIRLEPDGALAASAARLVRGAFRKDFRDRFEVELALFEFVLAYERQAHEARDPDGTRERLLRKVHARILRSPKSLPTVDELAAEHGMSRSHFSHFFRSRTGLTPARYITEVRVREAARMLVQTSVPLKQVADAWGFANQNHFCKVFKRFQHLSPGVYRQTIG